VSVKLGCLWRPLSLAFLPSAWAAEVAAERIRTDSWLPAVRSADAIRAWRPEQGVDVVDRGGAVVDRIGPDRRWVRLADLPRPVVDAFVAAEDRRFWDHGGVDPAAIARAAWADLRAGAFVQGGSTLTQQVVKLLSAGTGRTLDRKWDELFGALALEDASTKREILETWLNLVYLGDGATGLDAGARAWFGVGPEELTVGQAAVLASLVPAPNERSRALASPGAVVRRNRVLAAMADVGTLSVAEAERLSALPMDLARPMVGPQERHEAYRTEVRRQLAGALGGDGAPSSLVAESALHPDVQRLAERALRSALADVDGRRERRNPGAVAAEGAVVVLSNATGEVLALVEGRDEALGDFVRATQGLRQPGSAFKPFVYAAALTDGASPWDLVADEAVTWPGPGGRPWTPSNHLEWRGPITLRTALAVSSNAVAVRVASRVGLDRVASTAAAMGISTPLRQDLSLALGTSEVTVLDMAVAYATIARGGDRPTPVFVVALATGDGSERVLAGDTGRLGDHVVTLPGGGAPGALSPEVAAALESMLRGVVDGGTASAARRSDQRRAGKTGTTEDCVDAWFVGFTPRHTIAVWIGMDDGSSLGPDESGARVALPAWEAIADGLGTPGTHAAPEGSRPRAPLAGRPWTLATE
jgi:penicillin-binding protein 1A